MVHSGKGQEVNIYTFLCNMCMHMYMKDPYTLLCMPYLYMYMYMEVHKLAFHEHFRWDMSVAEEHYNTPPPGGSARTLASLQQNCTFSKAEKHLGSKHPPLLQLEPSSYIIDELHLLLRVADVLLRNLIHLADQLDQRQRHRGGTFGHHLHTLEAMVKSCGVNFRISHVSYIHKTQT